MNDIAIDTIPSTDVFTNDFSREVYETKYKYGNETIDDTQWRVANIIASKEAEPEKWAAEFKELLKDFKFVPGGRIMSNAGLKLGGTTMINCYVSGFQGEDRDSMESILDELRRQALILKSEGGYGFCVDTLRPRYSFISGIGSESPGAVKMLDMWDTQSSVITEGSGKKSTHADAKSGIRKGAQMVTMSIWHPDIEEFIKAKQTEGRLTKFNMSILITDKFMEAVFEHKPWDLIFPDLEANGVRAIYKKEWTGNIEEWKSKGYPVRTYKTFADANELWDMITSSTYTRNEPGILFIDRINFWNNLYWKEYISSTNPCGEQPLPTGGVCLLGNINLTQFVSKNGGWDFKKLGNTIRVAVRFMDNVNDLTYVPLPEQVESIKNKRRIGLGIMGYASALIMMKKRYGSPDAIKATHDVMKFITNTAYMCSSELAIERGSFEEFELENYMKSSFISTLDTNTRMSIATNGIRNSHLMSVQPTGNTSVMANNVSGGLEPIFKPEYVRTMIMANWPNTVDRILNVGWDSKSFELEETPTATYATDGQWAWIKEGDDPMLRAVFMEKGKEVVYKFDKNRGLTKEGMVTDYSIQYLRNKGEYDATVDYLADTDSLTIDDHIITMQTIALYIDSAMSKTINIPNEYSFEDFKNVYVNAYKSGVIKGCTTYRKGTMANVLAEIGDTTKENILPIPRTKAPKRPKTLDCDIHHMTIGGDKWIVLIGLYGEVRDPYEVFAFKRNGIQISPKIVSGKLVKIKMRTHQTRYDLVLEDITIEDVCSHFKSGEESALTRMLSTALRHGADMDYIYDQLMKAEGSIVSFSKAIARSIKKYVKTIHETVCKECGAENTLVMSEGCMKCSACGHSACS